MPNELALFAVSMDEDGCVLAVARVSVLDDACLVGWRVCESFDDLDLLETMVRVARAQRVGSVS